MTDPAEEPEPVPEPRTTAVAGGCLYTVLLLASVVWLALRERVAVIHAAAIGEHGIPVALVAGLVVGLAGFAGYEFGLRRLRAIAGLEVHIRRIFGGMAEAPILALILVGAVAEEMFFRLAVQDQFGLAGSVAAYTVVSTGAMGLRWMPVAALHAFVLGSLMALGFGLLATTTANAVMNYLVLRRMLTP